MGGHRAHQGSPGHLGSCPWLLLVLQALPCLPSSVFVQPGTELWAGADILIGCYTGIHAQVSLIPHPGFLLNCL